MNRYLLTPSLLNSWLWIWNCVDSVKEEETDEISLEDKIALAQQKALEDFVKTLKKIPSEPNKFMLEGIEFERQSYEGNTCVSPIIKGGCFQIAGKKNITVDGINLLMYGKLDVLKGGVIYDIKRVWKYSLPKYSKSCQHQFYLELFPRSRKFEYLIFDGTRLHKEVYYLNDSPCIEDVARSFLKWLKENDLLEVYFQYWRCKYNG